MLAAQISRDFLATLSPEMPEREQMAASLEKFQFQNL